MTIGNIISKNYNSNLVLKAKSTFADEIQENEEMMNKNPIHYANEIDY